MINSRLTDSARFTKRVIELVREHKLDYMDAIMQFVEEAGIEIEYAAQLVKRCEPIRQMLEAELVDARVLASPKDKPVALTNFMIDG